MVIAIMYMVHLNTRTCTKILFVENINDLKATTSELERFNIGILEAQCNCTKEGSKCVYSHKNQDNCCTNTHCEPLYSMPNVHSIPGICTQNE